MKPKKYIDKYQYEVGYLVQQFDLITRRWKDYCIFKRLKDAKVTVFKWIQSGYYSKNDFRIKKREVSSLITDTLIYPKD